MKRIDLTNPKTGVKFQLEVTHNEVFLTFFETKQVEKCSLIERDVDFLLWSNIEKQFRSQVKSLIVEIIEKHNLVWMK